MKRVFVAINQDSARVSDQDFADTIGAAALQQAEDVAPTWGIDPAAVVPSVVGATIAKSIPATLRTTQPGDPDGAVAWHDVDPATKEPRVTILTDKVAEQPLPFLDALTVAFTHEVIECADIFADEWVELPDGRLEAKELCDRVQNASYAKRVYRADGSCRDVKVSDFLTPDAFALIPTGEKCDFMDRLPRDQPRACLPDAGDGQGGGYEIIREKDGTESQIDGDRVAARRYSSGAMERRGVVRRLTMAEIAELAELK